MADNEKDVPIKEQDDGSVLARVDVPETFDDGENTKETVKDEDDHPDEEGDQDDGADQN